MHEIKIFNNLFDFLETGIYFFFLFQYIFVLPIYDSAEHIQTMKYILF